MANARTRTKFGFRNLLSSAAETSVGRKRIGFSDWFRRDSTYLLFSRETNRSIAEKYSAFTLQRAYGSTNPARVMSDDRNSAKLEDILEKKIIVCAHRKAVKILLKPADFTQREQFLPISHRTSCSHYRYWQLITRRHQFL